MTHLNPPGRLKLSIESALPILLILLLSWLFRLQFGSWINGDWHVMLYSRFIFWITVALLFAYTYLFANEPFLPWQEQPYSVKFYLQSVIILYLLVLVAGFIAAIPVLLGWHDDNQQLLKVVNLMNHNKWLMVFGSLTAGITEELLFRGFMLPRLQLLLKSKTGAVVISSLLFAALHYQYHSLREIIGPFLIGVIFAVHYQKYRNLKIVIIAHFLVDFIAFILAGHQLQQHIK